jgi:hypothetical protein
LRLLVVRIVEVSSQGEVLSQRDRRFDNLDRAGRDAFDLGRPLVSSNRNGIPSIVNPGACPKKLSRVRVNSLPDEQRVERRLAAIFAADVVGYSRLMGSDEEKTLAALGGIGVSRTGLVAIDEQVPIDAAV